jgi:hypothetical protein
MIQFFKILLGFFKVFLCQGYITGSRAFMIGQKVIFLIHIPYFNFINFYSLVLILKSGF